MNSKVKELVASGYVWFGMTKISNSADLVNHELYLHQLDVCLKQKHIPFVRFGYKEGRGIFFPAWYDDAKSWLLKPMRDSLAALFSRQKFFAKTFASKVNYAHILINA